MRERVTVKVLPNRNILTLCAAEGKGKVSRFQTFLSLLEQAQPCVLHSLIGFKWNSCLLVCLS